MKNISFKTVTPDSFRNMLKTINTESLSVNSELMIDYFKERIFEMECHLDDCFLGAYIHNNLVGLIWYPMELKEDSDLDFQDDVVLISDIFVHPDYQGKGIGKLLVQKVIEESDKDIITTGLDIYVDQFFQHLGFKYLKKGSNLMIYSQNKLNKST